MAMVLNTLAFAISYALMLIGLIGVVLCVCSMAEEARNDDAPSFVRIYTDDDGRQTGTVQITHMPMKTRIRAMVCGCVTATMKNIRVEDEEESAERSRKEIK